MTNYYLRIEGVNLGNFISDTNDLSTVRGSGLILLQAIKQIETEFAGRLKPISTGASAGLFEVAENNDPKSVAKEVRAKLKEGNNRFGTFVVDAVQAEDAKFLKAKELALAKNRFQQMRSPTLFIPTENDDTTVRSCELDNLRPALCKNERFPADKVKDISESVKARREYGREQKNKFYEEFADFKGKFVKEFETLTTDDTKGNLNRKMAVVYLDGNSFGKIQSKHCPDALVLAQFDNIVQAYRKEYLAGELNKMTGDGDWKFWNKKEEQEEIRFETLMWGGDEMLFVVPAWKGWEFVTSFFRASSSIPGSPGWNFNGVDLTHSGGVVFCHHNAPIGRIRKLAEALANDVKDRTERRGNFFSYEVLESFDHIGGNLSEYQKSRMPVTLRTAIGETGCLDGTEIAADGDFVENFRIVKDTAPRRRMYRIAKLLIDGITEADLADAGKKKKFDEDVRDEIEELFGEMGDNKDSLLKVSHLLNGPKVDPATDNKKAAELLAEQPMVWIHLNNLWDYIN